MKKAILICALALYASGFAQGRTTDTGGQPIDKGKKKDVAHISHTAAIKTGGTKLPNEKKLNAYEPLKGERGRLNKHYLCYVFPPTGGTGQQLPKQTKTF